MNENKTEPSTPAKKTLISFLINSVFYFLSSAFIISENSQYRLIVIHNGKILYDNIYSSLRGTRIAFQKLFAGNTWREEVKCVWSHFYDPDVKWLEAKLKYPRVKECL